MRIYELEDYMEDFDEFDKRNKKLMGKCITGLTIFALQFQRQHGIETSSNKVKEIRDLILEISGYWALDDFFQTDAEKQYLDLFDRHMREPSDLLYSQPPLTAESTLEGLYRFAMEMVVCQGNDLKSEIRE